MTHRINANFSDQAYRTLVDLSNQTGQSISEVLRQSISLRAWMAEMRAQGGHVLIERDGKIREVVGFY